MRIVRRCAALLGLLAGCYSPSAQEGAPCESSEQCPTPQRCVLGSCSLRDAPPIDASPPEGRPDASIDAPPPPIDAPPPLACSTVGLACTGAVTMFSCGGNCWVACTGNKPVNDARTACTSWMGKLGEIDDATEQGCVDANLNADTWLGLVQSDLATTPGTGWTWNGTKPLVYTHWLQGKPDDGGNEDGSEQCASMRLDGLWDDDNCGEPHDFVCERPQ